MTSSCTTMSIYKAARIRVKLTRSLYNSIVSASAEESSLFSFLNKLSSLEEDHARGLESLCSLKSPVRSMHCKVLGALVCSQYGDGSICPFMASYSQDLKFEITVSWTFTQNEYMYTYN
jgi:hypothetical protein